MKRKPSPTPQEVRYWVRAYVKGASVLQLAQECRYLCSTIKKYLKRSGVRIRGVVEAGALTILQGRRNYRHGPKHAQWKGGQRRDRLYVMVYCPGHPHANNNYAYEHVLKIERKIGRYLRKNEIVHHKNRCKSDNRLRNLQLLSRGEHQRLHLWKEISRKDCFRMWREYQRGASLKDVAFRFRVGPRLVRRALETIGKKPRSVARTKRLVGKQRSNHRTSRISGTRRSK